MPICAAPSPSFNRRGDHQCIYMARSSGKRKCIANYVRTEHMPQLLPPFARLKDRAGSVEKRAPLPSTNRRHGPDSLDPQRAERS